MKKLYKNRFIRYCFFGIIGGIIEIGLFDILYDLIKLNHIVSNVISFSISVIFLYCVNNKYVYKAIFENKKKKIKSLSLFIITRIIGLLIDTAVLSLCLYTFNMPGLISKVISCASTTFINYYMGKLIFK